MGAFLDTTALILLIPIVIGIGIMFAKAIDQQGQDHSRRTYRLSFPANLSTDAALEWVYAISGTLRSRSMMFTGTPTIAFEMWATNEGITHRVKVPWKYARYVVGQLQLAGIRVDPEDDIPHKQWTRAVEARLKNSGRTLHIDSPRAVSARILGSVQALGEDEVILIQWVVTPAARKHPPTHDETPRSHEFRVEHLFKGNIANRDEIDERRRKLGEPNMLAALRIAAIAETSGKAETLIYDVRRVLAATEGASTKFEKRLVSADTLQRRIDAAAGASIYPIQLSATELLSFIAWPIESPYVAGISPALSRHLPPSAIIPTKGRVLGTANMPGAEREIAMSYPSSTRHTHVLGRTGTGKSTLLANMMAQDMETGHGVILIEGKGDLFEAALDRIPTSRLDDVIVLDLSDNVRPVGFNIFDQGNSRTSIDELCSLIETMYKDSSQSIRAPQVLYHMTHALAEVPGSTFIDLPTMLTAQGSEENDWRDSIWRQVKDHEVSAFVQRYLNMSPKDQDQLSAPVFNRIWQFTSRPEIRNILGQRKSSFKMTDVIEGNKILLVNLNGIRVGKQTASLVGTLLVNAVWQAVRSVNTTKPNFLYLDEFQDFTGLPVDIESMLAKARSSNLGAVLAHQNLTQLRPELRSGVMANTATKVVFRISSDDARLMARELSRRVDDSDFTGLPEHDAIALVATDTGSSPPVSITTKPPGRSTHNAAKARQLSRLRYGRPVDEVKEEIMNRKATTPPRRRPRISGRWE